MWHRRIAAVVGTALAAILSLVLLLNPPLTYAQGSVTPSFGDGKLTLVGEGYRAGETVELTVRVAGAEHHFSATADNRGRFRLETGLLVPPLSKVEVEARDAQGQTQVTTTSAPAGPGGAPVGGAPLPPAVPTTVALPTQLPRTGDPPGAPLLAAVALLVAAGGALRRARR